MNGTITLKNLESLGVKNMIYKIPAVWQMYGYLEIEAESVEDAISIAESDAVGLPADGDYISDSFEVDHDMVDHEQ